MFFHYLGWVGDPNGGQVSTLKEKQGDIQPSGRIQEPRFISFLFNTRQTPEAVPREIRLIKGATDQV